MIIFKILNSLFLNKRSYLFEISKKFQSYKFWLGIKLSVGKAI